MAITPLEIAGNVQVSLPPAAPAPAARPAAPPAFDTVNVNFAYDREINRVVVTLYRADTGEVIREIPPEKIRHFIASMLEMLAPQFEATV